MTSNMVNVKFNGEVTMDISYIYWNDISRKGSNVKLDINNVCNLVRLLTRE
jgi:hypothetical protein